MDFFTQAVPKTSAMVHAVLGLLAVVAISGCQTSQNGQMIQAGQMDSFLESQYGPLSSFASEQGPVGAESGAGLGSGMAPVVITSAQPAVGNGTPPPVENLDDPFGPVSIVTDESQLTGSNSEQRYMEAPMYNGGIVRQPTYLSLIHI